MRPKFSLRAASRAKTSEPGDEVEPPAWAEAVLLVLLEPEDRESVSGDLLEAYRDSVCPVRGRRRADLWYMRQVAGFLWRATWLWGVLFAALFVGRTALDWLVPPDDFTTRGMITTYGAIGVFVAAGFWSAWRSRSLRASALAGIATSAIAAALSTGGALALLAIWHDAQTFQAIQRSGGLGEMFTLPVFAVVPGTVSAVVGGLFGKTAASAFRSHAAK